MSQVFLSRFLIYRKIPITSLGAYICLEGLFVIFLKTLYGILVEGAYFRGGAEFYDT